MSLRFGDFAWICNRSSLPLCTALGLGDPICYSRNISIYDFLLYQPSVLAVDLGAAMMTIIMILHIKSKYTAVGRKEMVIFFYIYLFCVLLELLLATQIVPISFVWHKYFTAAQIGMITAAFGTLLLNGFIGFQWTEDGTRASVWSFRIAAMSFFAIGFMIALGTFFNLFGMSSQKPIILFILLFIFNGVAALLYLALQLFLVFYSLHDLWPLGILTMMGFSNQICQFAVHYVDGMFLGSTFILLSVMMVYKYWDSITSEDLEFAISNGPQLWHLHNTMNVPAIASTLEHKKEV